MMKAPELNTSTPPSRGFFTPERLAKGMALFLCLGLAGRFVRYGLCFPLWEDECFLCVNFIDRTFLELLKPLDYHQVAPPLFLWLERAAVLLMGYSEWSLRLIPFLAAIASLFLFRRLCRALLDGPGQLLAFGAFAVAYPGIRYAAEAKQYSTDLFAALVIFALAVEWHRSRRPLWLWGLTLSAVPLLWLSYPAVFVAGGVSLAIGSVIALEWFGDTPRGSDEAARSARGAANLVGWMTLNAAILAGFWSLLLVIRRQSGAELGFMSDYWKDAFPPLAEPLQMILWLARTHSSELLAWPVGGARGASAFTAILCAIGLWQLLRTREPFWCCLILGPPALNFLAAALGRYPYGGHVKFSMYLGPAVCLLAGWGAAAWNARTAISRPKLARHAAFVTVCALALVAVASIGRDVANPYKTLSDQRARGFAQWFWFNAEAEGDVRVVARHGGTLFSPESESELTWTAMFNCNRAIYAPDGEVELPDTKEPLRCLVYRDRRFDFNEAVRDEWLGEMRERRDLLAHETFPFSRFGKGEEEFVTVDYLDIYTFAERKKDRTVSRDGRRVRR